MIKKVEYGNIKDVTYIEFGNGTISICNGESADGECKVLLLKSIEEPKEIGSVGEKTPTSNDFKPEIVIAFKNEESFSVFEKFVKNIREEYKKETMTAEMRLKDKLNSLTIEEANKRILFGHFGEENLKKLPFRTVLKKYLHNPIPSSGNDYREVNLLTGKVNEWCDVANYTAEPMISKSDLIWIEEEIFKKLDNKTK